jgi:hypothetical protein
MGKIKHWQKDHLSLRIVLKNHRTTAAQGTGQQNWIFIMKTLFPQELYDMSFTNPASTVELQLPNLWLLKVIFRCVNDGVTTIKPGYQTTGSAHVLWSDESSFTLFPTSGRVYIVIAILHILFFLKAFTWGLLCHNCVHKYVIMLYYRRERQN